MKTLESRIIYLLVIISLSVPIIGNFILLPAKMRSAEDAFAVVEKIEPKEGQIVLISLDWGPATSAENGPQTETIIEHLMRRRIPFAVVTTYPYGAPFLDSVPERVAAAMAKDNPGETWTYGKDWVNLGFQPGGAIMIQGVAKADDLQTVLKADARGTPLSKVPCMQKVHNIRDIPVLAQITGLTGTFSTWIQFFQVDNFKPLMIHGCTSITIPEAYIYYVSGQINGLFEGVAGAAWYDHLLSERYKSRTPTDAIKVNTSLATAHLVILGLIILGNIVYFRKRLRP